MRVLLHNLCLSCLLTGLAGIQAAPKPAIGTLLLQNQRNHVPVIKFLSVKRSEVDDTIKRQKHTKHRKRMEALSALSASRAATIGTLQLLNDLEISGVNVEVLKNADAELREAVSRMPCSGPDDLDAVECTQVAGMAHQQQYT